MTYEEFYKRGHTVRSKKTGRFGWVTDPVHVAAYYPDLVLKRGQVYLQWCGEANARSQEDFWGSSQEAAQMSTLEHVREKIVWEAY